MIYTVTETHFIEERKMNAGGKAREDLSVIFSECGIIELSVHCPQRERGNVNPAQKMLYHISIANQWKQILSPLKKGDSLVLQFPVINHTLFLNNVIKRIKKRGVKVFAFIHDLEAIRLFNDKDISLGMRWRMKKEELDELHQFDSIVVHNEKMKNYIAENLKIPEEKMVVLNIFDYLINTEFKPSEKRHCDKSCIIAGNLARNKSSFIYNLPDSPVFELYGLNYEEEHKANIHYNGSFLPDELPFALKGGFGLVWDGDSAETCSGAWGEYLRYNNPHKTSLYLACGIPVIIWEEAALADYILENKVGITIRSLSEIDDAISSMSEEDYMVLKNKAIRISKELREGYNTKKVLKQLLTN